MSESDKPIGMYHIQTKERPEENIGQAIVPFPYEDVNYGFSSLGHFNREIYRQYTRNPDQSIVIVSVGRPGNGKTTFNDYLRQEMQGYLSPELELNGKVPIFPEVEWGEGFPPIDPAHRVRERTDDRVHKQAEVDEAENYVAEGIQSALIGDYPLPEHLNKNPKYVKARMEGKLLPIVSVDLPLPTGRVKDGKQYGIVRGMNLLSELVNSSGRFEDLKGKYAVFVVGLEAAPEVRERATANRTVAKRQFLNDFKDATPDEMKELDENCREVLASFKYDGHKRFPTYETDDEVIYRIFEQNPAWMAGAIGMVEFPYILEKELRIARRRAIILYNSRVVNLREHEENGVSEGVIRPALAVVHPLREKYPDKFGIKNADTTESLNSTGNHAALEIQQPSLMENISTFVVSNNPTTIFQAE